MIHKDLRSENAQRHSIPDAWSRSPEFPALCSRYEGALADPLGGECPSRRQPRPKTEGRKPARPDEVRLNRFRLDDHRPGIDSSFERSRGSDRSPARAGRFGHQDRRERDRHVLFDRTLNRVPRHRPTEGLRRHDGRRHGNEPQDRGSRFPDGHRRHDSDLLHVWGGLPRPALPLGAGQRDLHESAGGLHRLGLWKTRRRRGARGPLPTGLGRRRRAKTDRDHSLHGFVPDLRDRAHPLGRSGGPDFRGSPTTRFGNRGDHRFEGMGESRPDDRLPELGRAVPGRCRRLGPETALGLNSR